MIKNPFRMVDKNMELDLEAMLDNIKDMNIRDPWLLEQTIEDCRTCYAVSIALIVLKYISEEMGY